MDSIVQEDMSKCFVCGTRLGLHVHHVFGGPNRKHSDKYKLTIRLCGVHHNLSNYGIHFNKDLDLFVKKIAQENFEEIYGHKKFMEIFKKNYI